MKKITKNAILKPLLRPAYWLYSILRTVIPGYKKMPIVMQDGVAICLSLFLLAWVLGYFLVNNSGSAQAAWFNDAWKYRQEIDITNGSGSDQTDFQVSFTLDTRSNNSSGLINQGKMQTACQDIRVADATGTIFPHWLEEGSAPCDNSATKIWTKVPFIPTAGTTFYVYYGNAYVKSSANGSQVFPFFDDFNSGIDFVNKWSNAGGTPPDASGGEITVTRGNIYTKSPVVSSAHNYIFEHRVKWTNSPADTDYAGIMIAETQGTSASNGTAVALAYQMRELAAGTDGTIAGYVADGTAASYNRMAGTTSFAETANTYYISSMAVTTDTEVRFYQNRAQTIDTANFTASTFNVPFYLWLGHYQGSSSVAANNIRDMTNDWVLVRKWAATEPSASNNAEEIAPSAILYWKFDDGQGTTAENSMNHSLDGTLNNTPTWKTEDQCVAGRCLWFDGANNENVSKSDDANLDFVAADNFTVQAWVKRNGASTANNFILTKAQAGYTGYKLYQDSSGDYCFDVRDGTNTDTACTNGVEFDDDSWHFVQGVKSGTTSITLYVDGKQRAQDASISATGTLANTGTFYAGVDLDGTSNEWLGFIDEVKVYRQARSDDQVKADFNARGNTEGAAVVLGASNNQPSALSNGLIGHWKMDEATAWNGTSGEVKDASGNGVNGTAEANATIAGGKFGNGGTFDGTGDCVDLGTSVLEMNTSNKMTISAWVNGTTLSGSDRVIIRKQTNIWSLQYIDGSTFRFELAANSTKQVFSTTTPSTGTWYHVMAVYDGSFMYMYVNGVLEGKTTQTGTIASGSGQGTAIGANVSAGTCDAWYWNGKLDEVRVYNRALSGAEVSQLYNWAPGPVGYWKMDEGSWNGTSNEVKDSSGNGNNGTGAGGASNTTTTGKYGKAGNFDGVDDRISVPDSDSLDFNNTMTISAWVKANTISTNIQMFEKRDDASDNFHQLSLRTTNTARFSFKSDGGGTNGTVVATTGSVIPGRWYHIAGTADGTNLKIYINGVLDTTDLQDGTGGTGMDNDIAYIGSRNTASNFFDGLIDELKVYNYAQTQGQIVEDMNAGHPAPGSPVGSALGHWKFDEGADNRCSGGIRDACNSGSQGTALDGAKTGMATTNWTNSGKFNKALVFDGSDDYISLTGPNIANSSFTISAWAKRNATGGTDRYIYSQGSSGTTRNLLHFGFRNDDLFTCDFWSDGEDTTVTTTDTNWHYWSCTFDSSTLARKIYKDGILVASDTAGGNFTGTTTATIGVRTDLNSNYFSGTLDEVKVYGSALTPDQIKMDMNQGKAQVMGALSDNTNSEKQAANQEYCVPGDTSICTAPIGRWDLEEKGQTVYDTSGNGNNGFLGVDTTVEPADDPLWVNGKNGAGLDFVSADKVTFGSTSTFDVTNITVQAWVWSDIAGNGQVATMDDGSNPGRRWNLGVGTSGNFRFAAWISDTQQNAESTTNFSTNAWHHLTGTYDGETVKLYVDGVLTAENTTPSGNLDTDAEADLRFGMRESGTTDWDGKVDNVRIFGYARTPQQIAWDYNKGAPKAWYKLDECQGMILNDASGNGQALVTVMGSGGIQTTGVGTCSTPSTAWGNGVTGKRNYSLSLDTDDYAVGSSLPFTTSASQVSWAFWVKPRSLTGNTLIWSKGVGADINFNTEAWHFLAMSDPTMLALIISASEDDLLTLGLTPAGFLANDTWVHVVAVYDGTQSGNNDNALKIYKNGIQQTLTFNGTIPPTTRNATTGTSINAGGLGGGYFNGTFDDMRVYNYPLTPPQIKSIYNDGAVRYGPETGAP